MDTHMKTLYYVTLLAFVLTYESAYGQGTFEMRNLNTFAGVNAPIFDAQGVPLAGPKYLAELWGGATNDSLSPAVDAEVGGQRLTVPFFTGGYIAGSRTAFILSVPGGGFAWLQVRAWDARLGSTYEEVLALNIGGYGESNLLFLMSGNPNPNPTLPSPLTGLQSFSLLPVIPEPGSAALLWCGALALVAFRRWSGK